MRQHYLLGGQRSQAHHSRLAERGKVKHHIWWRTIQPCLSGKLPHVQAATSQEGTCIAHLPAHMFIRSRCASVR